MSLGQRLQKAPEKGSGEQSPQDYEASMRRLKLLSKSQTALLKAFLHGKLVEGEQLVLKSIELLASRGDKKDPQLEELRRSLQALKLKELEVDVSSVQLSMQQELATLRSSIDNGGVNSQPSTVAASATSTGPSAEDIANMKRLEAEDKSLREQLKKAEADNKSLREQLKDVEARLTVSNDAISKANGNASELANSEIKSLKSQVDSLKRDAAAKEAQIAEKDGTITNHAATVATLTKELQAKTASESNKEEALRREIDTARAELKALEAKSVACNKDWEGKLAASTKNWEAAVAGKAAELARVDAEKERALQEQEARLEAEKEEMMEAMAQEIEEIETTKAAEFDAVNQQLAASQSRVIVLQNNTKGLTTQLKQLATVAHTLSRDYKAHKSQANAALGEMSQSIMVTYQPVLTQKLKNIGDELALATTRYRKEMLERKKLHNLVQELKGNIRVYMRCRPPTRKELEQFGDEAQCVSFPNPGEVKVFNEKNREKLWEFDETFDTSTNQEQVYAEVAALVTSVMDGFNVCIFAYGQTGSGKTWTMSGPADNRGVNTRALEDLFNKADSRRREWRDTITVSLLEVYNEEIRDLLSDSASDQKLEVKLGPYGNHVPGLTSLPVDNIESVLNLITMADRNRSSATTNMNEHSSRSHMILTATIISEYLPTGLVTRGKLNLVDLAGSERINKSGATGQALKEAQNINKSLSALGDVIAARAAKQSHVPFRNSTLTYLLQDSISQDSKTLMIVCVSPVLYNSEETFCSLNFAGRVRTVELGRASKTVTSGTNSTGTTPPPPPGTSSGFKKNTNSRHSVL